MGRSKAKRRGDKGGRVPELERALQKSSLTYGQDDQRLEKWQLLCDDCGVDRGASIRKCKAASSSASLGFGTYADDEQALQTVSINIWDLMKARDTGDLPVGGYQNKAELRKDLKNPHRRFPLAQVKSGAENKLLGALLVTIA